MATRTLSREIEKKSLLDAGSGRAKLLHRLSDISDVDILATESHAFRASLQGGRAGPDQAALPRRRAGDEAVVGPRAKARGVETGGTGPSEASDRQRPTENPIDKPDSRCMGSSEDHQYTVRSYKGYDQASLFTDGSDDPSAVLPENKTAYISQILAPLTVLTVSISYKQSRRKHSKVLACPMNRSITGKIDQIRRHARPPKVCLTARAPRPESGDSGPS